MPLHFSFAFGVGSYFNFSFTIGHPAANTTRAENTEPDGSSSRRCAKLPMSRRYATSTGKPIDRHDHGIMPLPGLDMLDRPSLRKDAHGMNVPSLDFQDNPSSDTVKSLKTEIKAIRAATRTRPTQLLPVNLRNPKVVASSDTPKAGQYAPENVRMAITHCPLYTRVPIEVRDMIYRHVLVSSEPITRAHDLIGYKTLVANNHHPIPNIDSRVMQTCRLIYEETLPILYGGNIFEFSSPNSISHFADARLSKSSMFNPASTSSTSNTSLNLISNATTAFAFKPAPSGRLTLLRTVRLRFTASPTGLFGGGFGGTGQVNASDRDYVWADWSRTLFSDTKQSEYASNYVASPLSFPSLERLILDFTEWGLTDKEALMVEPILRTLNRFPNLKAMLIEGVSHQATLENFGNGFHRGSGSRKGQGAEEAAAR